MYLDILEEINPVLPSVLSKLGFLTEGTLRNAQHITSEEFISHSVSLSSDDYLRYQGIYGDSSWAAIEREMEDRRRVGEDLIVMVVEGGDEGKCGLD